MWAVDSRSNGAASAPSLQYAATQPRPPVGGQSGAAPRRRWTQRRRGKERSGPGAGLHALSMTSPGLVFSLALLPVMASRSSSCTLPLCLPRPCV
jgi:hypothetical protein